MGPATVGGHCEVRTSEHEHKRGLARAGAGERTILAVSSAAAWTAFPAAVFVYLLDLVGRLNLDMLDFDLVEAWLLAFACVGVQVASLRADGPMIEAAWHEGLRLGVGHDTGQSQRHVRIFARRCVWMVMGYIACVAWTAAAIVTVLVMRHALHPTGNDLMIGMVLLLIPAVQGTVVRLVGPGLTRIRAAYDAACTAQQALHEHAEVYEYMREVHALELVDLLRTRRVLEMIQVVDALIEDRRAEREGGPRLRLVEDQATRTA